MDLDPVLLARACPVMTCGVSSGPAPHVRVSSGYLRAVDTLLDQQRVVHALALHALVDEQHVRAGDGLVIAAGGRHLDAVSRVQLLNARPNPVHGRCVIGKHIPASDRDMALVGPRPTSFGVETYDLWHTARLELRPGMTGLWQVTARADLECDIRVRLELAYAERMSTLLDIEILARTFGAVFNRSGQ